MTNSSASPWIRDVPPHCSSVRTPCRSPLPGRAGFKSPKWPGAALRQAGYNLLLADAGYTGYATAMRQRPDLVLVDLSLSLEVSGPDACLDGRGVLKMLSELPSGRALPFIGLVSKGASEAQVL